MTLTDIAEGFSRDTHGIGCYTFVVNSFWRPVFKVTFILSALLFIFPDI